MLNVTQIPADRVAFIDPRTGLVSREWYRFLLNLFDLTGGGSNSTTLEDLQLTPAAIDYSADISKIRADLEIGTAPFPNFGTLAYQNAENVTVVRLNTVDPTTGVSNGHIYENANFLVLDGTAGVVQSFNGTARTVTQNTGFRPFLTNAYDLGTFSQTWKSLYTTDIWFNGSAAKNLYSDSSFSIIDGSSGSIMAANGTTVAVAQATAFRPRASSSYTLGTSGQRWTSIYADELLLTASGTTKFYDSSSFAVIDGSSGSIMAANGTAVAVAQSNALRPNASSTYSLGTSSQRWTSIYANELIAGASGAAQYQENSGFAVVNGTSGVVTAFNGTAVTVTQATGFRPFADNTYTLGTSGQRWSEVYAAVGTINTSDGTQKQQVRDLTDAERNVAKAIKGLIRAYKFNNAVEAKGDEARIHIGVIAQDVQAAFAAEGLDATKYGLFCSDTYDTLDGKTETRLGVRYGELLAFVIGSL
jgi:hypothetical protein